MNETSFRETNHPALHYQHMLADTLRMQRYAEAIERVVKPGDTVADLGTGTGILALMALRAGANKVYAIDNSPRADLVASAILQANDPEGRISLITGDVREVELPVKVDVILNELIGDFGTDENIYECVRLFAAKNLKENGCILPSELRTFILPVEYQTEFRGVWRQNFHGFDMRSALDIPCLAEAVMWSLFEPAIALAVPATLEDIQFSADMPERPDKFNCTIKCTKAGRLQGFIGYFEAVLTEGISLLSYPCYPGCHWQNWNWPVTPPIELPVGALIEATLDAPGTMIAPGWKLDWKLLQ